MDIIKHNLRNQYYQFKYIYLKYSFKQSILMNLQVKNMFQIYIFLIQL